MTGKKLSDVVLALATVTVITLWIIEQERPIVEVPPLGPNVKFSMHGHVVGEQYPEARSGSSEQPEFFFKLSGQNISGKYDENGKIILLCSNEIEIDGIKLHSYSGVTLRDITSAWGPPSSRSDGVRGSTLWYRQWCLQVTGDESGRVSDFRLWESRETYEKAQASLTRQDDDGP